MKPNKYEYSLRFALIENTDIDNRINSLIDFCKKAKIDDVMFFINAEDYNYGHYVIDRSKAQVAAIKKAGKELKKHGITLSLNPWITFIHGGRGRKLLPGQDFTTMVYYNGIKDAVVACPLCENWRKNFVEAYKYFCTELDVDTVWIEDDYRMSGHEPPTVGNFGCFCDLHMAKFCEALGKKVTREEFVRGILNNESGYREAFVKVNGNCLEETMQYIIDGLKGVQDGFGLMTSGANGYFAEGRDQEKIFTIMGERRKPLHRLALMMYRQDSPLHYKWLYRYSLLQRKMATDVPFTVGEIENFPMTLASKSAKFTGFHMEMTLPLCLKGQTLDIFEFNGNGITNENLFVRELTARKEFFQSFMDTGCKIDQLRGVKCLISQNAPLFKKIQSEKMSDIMPDDTYLAGYLSSLGISVEYIENIPQGETVAVSGQVLRAFDKEQVESLFKNNFVILTGTAVAVLCDLGLGYLAKVKGYTELQERTGVYSYEQGLDERILSIPDERSSAQYFCGNYMRIDFDECASIHEYTDMHNYDFSRVGYGICRVGSNVLIAPYVENEEYPFGLMTPLRSRAIYAGIMDGKRGKDVICAANENVTPFYFKEKDIIVFNNFSDDEYDDIPFCGEVNYRYAEVFGKDGCSGKIALKKRNGELVINYPLHGCSSVYVKFYDE